MLFCQVDIINIDYEKLLSIRSGNSGSNGSFLSRTFGKVVKSASPLIDRNRSKIIQLLQSKITQSLQPYGVVIGEVHGRDLIVGEERMFRIDISVNEIDYHQLVEYLVPKLLSQKAGSDPKLNGLLTILQEFDRLPQKMLIAALDTLSEDEKNKLITQAFRVYKEDLMKIIAKQEWSNAVDIHDINISNI